MDVRRDVVRIRVLVRQRKDGEITEWEGCVCTDCVQQPAATETGKNVGGERLVGRRHCARTRRTTENLSVWSIYESSPKSR